MTPDSAPAARDDSGRWRTLGLLSMALILSMTTWFSASAVIPQLREEWALSTGAAAWLTIAVQIGFVAGALTSALLNLPDVVAPRHVILGGAAGAAAANLVVAWSGGVGAALPLRFLTGFFLAGVYPPALKLLSTWFVRGRGTALGILVGAITVGTAGPHLVNGLGGLDWRVVIFVTSALTLTGGLLVEAAVAEGPYPFPRAVFDPRQARSVLANRGVRLASLGYFGHMWELYAMWTWFLVFFTESMSARGGDPGRAPAFSTFAVIGIGGVGCWVGGLLGDRWGRSQTAAVMLAISGVCSLLIGLTFGGPSWGVLALGLVWGFSVVADSAQFSTMVTELADQAYVGTAVTLQLAVGFTLTVATIWLVPVIETTAGWPWTFAFLVPGPVLGIAAMLRLRGLPEAAQIASANR
jgi:MFS family permease